MQVQNPFASIAPPEEDPLLRSLVEGTASATGERFFRDLVTNLARALGTKGAWIATFEPKRQVLDAIAFTMDGTWVEDYSYDLAGTPCETAIEQLRCVHIPERLIELYPNDHDLPPADAVSYLGVPLLDSEGRVIGQLAVLDDKVMPENLQTLGIFRIFANRAAAELERINGERTIREREAQLSRLFDSAMDAIVNLDADFNLLLCNPAAGSLLGLTAAARGGGLRQRLTPDSMQRLERCAKELARHGERPSLWLPGGLTVQLSAGQRCMVEATLSAYESDGQPRYTLILRNVEERLSAERKIQTLTGQTEYLQREVEERGNFDGIIGSSEPLRAALEEVERVANTDATVLLLGETGTGKELFARSIHASSPRRGKALIRVNCGAIPENLIESELFGHERGAFTGATTRREGRFALADGGTLLLDEVGELPLALQPKLLRVLQEGEFEPVGSSRTRRVDVRVIAATHRDLPELVAREQFREDLYYRLNVFPIRIPPLRERCEDIPTLAQSFIDKYASRIGRKLSPLSATDVARLQSYHWPGNVRELQNVLERAVIVSDDGSLRLDRVLPGGSKRSRSAATNSPARAIRTAAELAELERDNIVQALEQAHWKVSGAGGAAELLQMNASTLSSRMRALDIRRPHR